MFFLSTKKKQTSQPYSGWKGWWPSYGYHMGGSEHSGPCRQDGRKNWCRRRHCTSIWHQRSSMQFNRYVRLELPGCWIITLQALTQKPCPPAPHPEDEALIRAWPSSEHLITRHLWQLRTKPYNYIGCLVADLVHSNRNCAQKASQPKPWHCDHSDS